MNAKYVFVSNIMYNSQTIRRVRWWNVLFGFPGEIVLATVICNEKQHTMENYAAAREEFEKTGLFQHVMGRRY